jgi:hypothetical protein
MHPRSMTDLVNDFGIAVAGRTAARLVPSQGTTPTANMARQSRDDVNA